MSISKKAKLMNALMLSAAVLTGVAGMPGVDLQTGQAVAAALGQDKSPVDFSADHLSHDEVKQTVTATGSVEMVQGKKILRADKVVYELNTDKVTAEGNVSLLQENGDVAFVDYVELSDEMKDGFARSLVGFLADGSRFTAVEVYRRDGTVTEMKTASFTPCKICEGREPLWQLKASKVTHDQDAKKVSYQNARMEMFGVPAFYTPVFSHPDPTIKRKSGFLRPSAGWSTELGANARAAYYWDIAPDKDATFEVRPTKKQGTVLGGEWRQRFEKGRLYMDGSFNRSDRVVKVGNQEIEKNGRLRGHLFADALYDINEKWRAGLDYNRSSDEEYLRLFDISNEDVLESEAYMERFSGRSYTRVSAQSFQDVRINSVEDQPNILPYIEHIMYGEPDATLGGRWELSSSLLGLSRNDGQDVGRASLKGGWERHFISDTGMVATAGGSARADFYEVRDRDVAQNNPALDNSSTGTRYFPEVHLTSSYPLVKNMERSQAVIEPIVSLVASPDIDNNDNSIPNEDSQDVQIDVTNLFDVSRFPGIDRIEDGAHAAYGVKTGIFGHEGNSASVFLGQSYRFKNDGLFPQGSGLENQHSDYVGQVSAYMGDRFNLDYRFQFSEEDLESRRHELIASSNFGRFGVNTRYLFARNVTGTGLTKDREQLRLGGFVALTNRWRVGTSTLTDLGEEPGLRTADLALSYRDECFSFAILGERNLTDRPSGQNETTVMMRLGFKYLGEVSTPEILLQSEAQGAN